MAPASWAKAVDAKPKVATEIVTALMALIAVARRCLLLLLILILLCTYIAFLYSASVVIHLRLRGVDILQIGLSTIWFDLRLIIYLTNWGYLFQIQRFSCFLGSVGRFHPFLDIGARLVA